MAVVFKDSRERSTGFRSRRSWIAPFICSGASDGVAQPSLAKPRNEKTFEPRGPRSATSKRSFAGRSSALNTALCSLGQNPCPDGRKRRRAGPCAPPFKLSGKSFAPVLQRDQSDSNPIEKPSPALSSPSSGPSSLGVGVIVRALPSSEISFSANQAGILPHFDQLDLLRQYPGLSFRNWLGVLTALAERWLL